MPGVPTAEPLARDIFITKPVPEFKLDPSQCLELLILLCGLSKPGDMWHKTPDKHHIHDLGMQPLLSDLALYILMADGLLKISGGQVDDLIRTGAKSFKKLCSETKEKFNMAEDQSLPCVFIGFSLSQSTKALL